MTGIDDTPSCVHAEDLVSYLYGEADADTALSFEAHVHHCASCRTELAGFGQARTAIGEWRTEALGAPSTAVAAHSSVVAVAPARSVSERKRSALAAMREFFSLSPLWMRAATAALAIVFCALVALTIARSFEEPKTIIVERVMPSQPSGEKAPEVMNGQNKEQAAVQPAPQLASPEQQVVKVSDETDRARPGIKRDDRKDAAGQRELAKTPKLKISPQESREIARDLRLVASNDEEDLPRLSDLIDETN